MIDMGSFSRSARQQAQGALEAIAPFDVHIDAYQFSVENESKFYENLEQVEAKKVLQHEVEELSSGVSDSIE